MAIYTYGDLPVKQPNGRMRPTAEAVPSKPHSYALSTFRPRFTGEGPPQDLDAVAEGYELALAVLERRLKERAQKVAGAWLVLKSEVFRLAQVTKLPLDDREVFNLVRRCPPDESGRIRVADVIASLRTHHFAPRARPAPSPEFAGITEQFSKVQVPRSALMATNAPDPYYKPKSHLEYPGAFVPDDKMTYVFLPSCPNAQPHRSAQRMRQNLAQPSSNTAQKVQALKMALYHNDHNGSRVLPRPVVMQYMKLHGLWSNEHSPQMLAQLEPPGLTRCVDYGKLLALLTPM